MTFGELLETSYGIAEKTGCNNKNSVHAYVMGRIMHCVTSFAKQRHRAIYPQAEGTPMDSDLEIDPTSLFDIASEIESITQEDCVVAAFYQVLPPEEKPLLMELSAIMANEDDSKSHKATKQMIRSRLLTNISRDAMMLPVIEAVLEDGDPIETMKIIAIRNGHEIEKIDIPQTTGIFIRTLRIKLNKLIGAFGRA